MRAVRHACLLVAVAMVAGLALPAPASSQASPTFSGLRAVGDRLFFHVQDARGNGLGVVDPGSDTYRVLPIGENYNAVVLPPLGLLHGVGLFAADDGRSGSELWVTDGTEEGTRLFLDLREGPDGSGASVPVIIGDRGWFFADDGTGVALWTTDGTPDGTVKVAQPGWHIAYDIVALGERVYFAALDDTSGRELWTSDGTADGTHIVADIWPGPMGGSPGELTPLGDRLVFAAQRGDGIELWITDGTEQGTTSLDTPADDDEPVGLVALDDVVIFTGRGEDFDAAELWRTDGTVDGTAALGVQSDGGKVPWQGRVWLLSDGGLWSTDGTAAGTEQVVDLGAGGGTIAAARSQLFIDTMDALWRSDGTSDGTVRLAPIDGESVLIHWLVPIDDDAFVVLGSEEEESLHRTGGVPGDLVEIRPADGPEPSGSPSPTPSLEPSPEPSASPEPTPSPEPSESAPDPFDDLERTQSVGSEEPVTSAVAVSTVRFADAGDAAARSAQPVGQRTAAHVVLSRDDAFPDSLAGAGLTGDGPLLLTATAALPSTTRGELQRVLAPGGRVYLLGGVTAISQSVEDALRADGYEVVRLFGDSRVETSLAVADEVRRRGGATDRVLVARAYGGPGNETSGWADSVTGGGWSAASGVPVVVTQSEAVHPALAAWLANRGVSSSVLLGGETALSTQVEAGVPQPLRVSGAERTATAVAIARSLWQVSATGDRAFAMIDGFHPGGWKVGLAAAGLAADAGAPLLVVGDEIPGAVAELVSSCGEPEVATVAIGVVAEDVRAALDELDGGAC